MSKRQDPKVKAVSTRGNGYAEEVSISSLKANPSNPRIMRDDRFAKLKKSITEFPDMMDKRPIVAVTDKDGKLMVLGGNMRLRACQDLGLKTVPVVLADDWTEEQRRRFIIADNVGFGEHDFDLLANEWDAEDLSDWGLDLPVGFGAELNEGLTDPDEVPVVPETPITVLGDVWVMGKHRIVCGDSTEADTVAKCLNGVKPHLMVTDPPYGVEYRPEWRKEAGVGGSGTATGVVMNDDRADWREAWALFPGSVAYVWHAGTFAGDVAASLQSCKFKLRAQIVWVKTRHVLSRGDYHHQHEPAYYGVKDGADENWNFVPEHEVSSYAVKKGAVGHYVGGRKQSTVWFIEHLKSGTGHGTQKPVECMKRPIENNSSPGQAVYEPFSGSGTTIIAGEMTGRSIHAIELSPEYVDVAVKRWQDFTGQQAIHEASGKTFEELSDAQASTV